jgi:3-deoxy-D-manno-octulosonic-acid transferase
MPSTSRGYRAAVRLGAALAPALGLVDRKVGDGHRGRRGAVARLAGWSAAHRDPRRPLAWFHAASVGEGLQAESVLLEFQRLLPDAQLVYTHFSPSAEPLARRLEVDAADYLPYDLPSSTQPLLAALRPDLLVFAKLDLWPELAVRAAGAGTTVAMVAATVSAGSGRLRWPARALLRAGYASVAAAGAIAQADAERLARLGVPPDGIQVLGDPRFDSVSARVGAVRPDDPLLRHGADAPTLVAGSTWPLDEDVLLAAFAEVRRRHANARLILVPHEPTVEHLARVERTSDSLGLGRPARLSAADEPAPLLVVDRVGVLSALYGAGRMAYVGGGFGRAGLHSVLEPAAWGIPVAFGPRWRESRDAALLMTADAARPLENAAEGTAGLVEIWSGWIEDEAGRAAAGRRALEVVRRGQGAARRSAEMLAALTSSPRPRR